MIVILFLLFVHAIVIQIPLSSSPHNVNVNFNHDICFGSDNFSIRIINPTLRVTIPDEKYINHTSNIITVCQQANLDMSVDYNANINNYAGYYSRDNIANPNLVQVGGQYTAVLVYGPRGDRKTISNAHVNVVFTPTAQVSPSSYTASTTTSLNLQIRFNFTAQTNLIYNNSPFCNRSYGPENITTLNYNLAIYVINPNIGASIQKIAGPTEDRDYFRYTIKITNTGLIPFKVTNIRPDRGSIISIEPDILNRVINTSQYVEFGVKTTRETRVLYFDLNSDYCGTTITSTLQLGLDPSFRCTINPNPIWILNQSGASNSTSIDCGGSSCDNVIFSPISELSIRHTGYTIDVTLNRIVNRPSDVVRINATRGSNRYSCELNINYYANNSTLQCTINPNPIWILNQSGASNSTSIDCGGSSCDNVIFSPISELSIRHTGYTIDVTLNRIVNRPSDVVRINATKGPDRYSCELNINYYANNSTLQCTINPNPVNMVNRVGSSAIVQVLCDRWNCSNMTFTGVPGYLNMTRISAKDILIQMNGTASNSMDTISITARSSNNTQNYRCNLIITYSNLTNPCRSRI
jgi:hypothetical protein